MQLKPAQDRLNLADAERVIGLNKWMISMHVLFFLIQSVYCPTWAATLASAAQTGEAAGGVRRHA